MTEHTYLFKKNAEREKLKKNGNFYFLYGIFISLNKNIFTMHTCRKFDNILRDIRWKGKRVWFFGSKREKVLSLLRIQFAEQMRMHITLINDENFFESPSAVEYPKYSSRIYLLTLYGSFQIRSSCRTVKFSFVKGTYCSFRCNKLLIQM